MFAVPPHGFSILALSLKCRPKLLNDEQNEIYEKYQECWNEYVSLAEAAIFEYAFSLGARLTHEALFEEQKKA